MIENISSTVNTDWGKLCKSLKGSGNKDWVSTFHEEPKEIPLRNTMVKMEGRIYLVKRMAFLDVVE